MYKVIRSFQDMQDNWYQYETGDTFPRKGKKASAERLKELASSANRQGTPLIEEVKKKNDK